MDTATLDAVALGLVGPGKGILAADESGPTIAARLESIGVESSEPSRVAYRDMLLTAHGLEAYISGVILYDETIRQKNLNGMPFVDFLAERGIKPGIKVDRGAKPLAGFPGEKVTEGLDGLRERLAEYARFGARFTKWRAVFAVTAELPTRTCIVANVHALARFAALSQEAGLVPIVEPEVLMDGDHKIGRHYMVTETVLRALFTELAIHGVHLEGLLLKTNMVLSGTTCPEQASVTDSAHATWRCLERTVPAAVPGIVFLSGGQTDIRATEHLNALNRIGHTPWELSFSFGRALQAPALKKWGGQPGNVAAAQEELLKRARCNSAARFGRYDKACDESAPVAARKSGS